ncbi:hypothetical protein J41TS12_07660 [Paenibacillus antibioticophila]|uniref:Uncharacterized protein n=1 Tax=Paenibacillus antibioticophila TaxID=1274374 RepID=A0A920CDU3_9BACL|nr:hypothetical protein J41TS12_07660 [Paenibacillus antibioticophila]
MTVKTANRHKVDLERYEFDMPSTSFSMVNKNPKFIVDNSIRLACRKRQEMIAGT